MSLVLITPPSVAALSISDCNALLGISGSDQDTALTGAIAAVAGTLDPASGGWLRRALRPQQWELRIPQFYGCDGLQNFDGSPVGGAGVIELPFPPLISIDSVAYDDTTGTPQTLVVNTDYRVFGIGEFGKARICPAYGQSWPSVRWDAQAVRIRFTCGYPPAVTGPPAVADALPAAIKSAIALQARQLSVNGSRDLSVSGETVDGVSTTNYVVSPNAAAVIREAMESLLWNYRVWD